MIREVMDNIQLWSLLRKTPIVLQMDDRSTIKLEGIMEVVIVSNDYGNTLLTSWFCTLRLALGVMLLSKDDLDYQLLMLI
jgi:hypothetical protein